MNASPGWHRWEGDDLILKVRVQPRASRDELGEAQESYLKVRITAPPVDGKANADLMRFLADVFNVAKSRITLLDGETSREKRLRIESPRTLPPGIPPPGRL